MFPRIYTGCIAEQNALAHLFRHFPTQIAACIRPSKKINMFLVWVVEKYQKEGIFIFFVFYWETTLNTHIKHAYLAHSARRMKSEKKE